LPFFKIHGRYQWIDRQRTHTEIDLYQQATYVVSYRAT